MGSILTRALSVVLLACCAVASVSAQSVARVDLHDAMSIGTARSVLVMNAKTEEVLWAQNADIAHPIASLTKLMTVAVVMNSGLDMQRMVKIISADVRKASTTHLRTNDHLTVTTLVYLMMVGSDNAAARALARTVSPTQTFVASMNTLAQELHLSQTVYTEPSGLNVGNRASAQDIAKLVVYTRERSQWFLPDLLNTRVFNTRIGSRTIVVANTNRFMDEHTLVSKTGYTAAAKYCLTMMIDGADGEQYVIVVIGAPSSATRFEIGKLFVAELTKTSAFSEEADDLMAFMPATISEEGKEFIRVQEKLSLRAYYDKTGYAIGYGMHTWNGRAVTRLYPGSITEDDVEIEFERQLQNHVEVIKSALCAPLVQPMLDSLVSVSWNLGRINTAIIRKFEQNRPVVVADFLTTATVRRRPSRILITRRLQEYLLFSGDYAAAMGGHTARELYHRTRGTQVVIVNDIC